MTTNTSKQGGSVPLYSKLTNLFGVSFTNCLPILAGNGTDGTITDAAGRNLEMGQPPLETIFYNLRPDRGVIGNRSWVRMDYIIGESDPEKNKAVRFGDGNLVYWQKASVSQIFHHNQAIIVRLSQAELNDAAANRIDDNWLALRRVGDEEGKISDDNGRSIFIRTRSKTGDILTSSIDVDSVLGFVFAKHTIRNHQFVKTAENAPFHRAKPIKLKI